MVEGHGIAGTYGVRGSVNVYSQNGQYMMNVHGSAYTPAMATGDVSFSGNAQLLVDGIITQTLSLGAPSGDMFYETGTFPVSTGAFMMPNSAAYSIDLKINTGYVYRGPEGPSTPIPAQLNFSVPIYRNNTQYLGPSYR